jgi:hypothetical protein
MDPTEAADQIRETNEEEREERAETDKFKSRAALLIAVLAMCLAITTLGGGNVAEDMVNSNIKASDTWSFYQAKNVRQTLNELAADQLELELQRDSAGMSTAIRKSYQEKIEKYRSRVERYESEPDPKAPNDPTQGEGKKELMARAKQYEQIRLRAQEQDPNFDYAEALFQIAIVLGSVAILATSRPVLRLSIGTGVLAVILMLNGYFLLFQLPF